MQIPNFEYCFLEIRLDWGGKKEEYNNAPSMVSTYKFRIITFITKETNFKWTVYHNKEYFNTLPYY